MATNAVTDTDLSVWGFMLRDEPLTVDQLRLSYEVVMNAGGVVDGGIKAIIDLGRAKATEGFQALLERLRAEGLVVETAGKWKAIPRRPETKKKAKQQGLFE
jgi:hypothetical protein